MDIKAISGLLSRIRSLCDEVGSIVGAAPESKKLTKEEYLSKNTDERRAYDQEQVVDKSSEGEES